MIFKRPFAANEFDDTSVGIGASRSFNDHASSAGQVSSRTSEIEPQANDHKEKVIDNPVNKRMHKDRTVRSV